MVIYPYFTVPGVTMGQSYDFYLINRFFKKQDRIAVIWKFMIKFVI